MLKAYPTCAEKIVAYAAPYEEWLAHGWRAEEDVARRVRIQVQSQAVCGASGSMA